MMLGNSIDRVGIAVAVAISAVGYFGGIRPVVAHEAARLLTERDVEGKQRRLEALRDQVAKTESGVRGLESRVSAFRSSFEASPRVNERIGELAQLADVLGVSVESIRPGQPAEGNGFTIQPISISGTGDAGDIARFLSRLREVFPDMGARTFAVTGQTTGASSLSAEFVWFAGFDGQAASADAAGE